MWKITKDYIHEPDEKDKTGTESVDYDEARVVKVKKWTPFRLYDDDDNLYYEGVSSNSSSFRPLDEFGEGYAGCTMIRYLSGGGVWEDL
jgi:hypothetical protein